MLPPWLRATSGGVEVRLYVQPRASRDQLAGTQGEELKVRLAAPPVDGAANAACCDYIAKRCALPRRSVTLVAGEASRHKRVLLAGADPLAVARALGGEPAAGNSGG